MLALGGCFSPTWGSFISLFPVEKFGFTKTAQVIKIQLKKHKAFTVFPAVRFDIQMQSKYIRVVQHSPQWKNIMVSGLGA